VVKGSFGIEKTWKGILLAVVLVANAWAASKGSLDLQRRTNVGEKQLASGSYTVRWEGKGDQVEVKIYSGGKLVATAPARVVKVDYRQPYDTALVSNNQDGSVTLSEIRFGGKDYALQISAADGGAAAGGGSAK
jgi:hypothetical protein